MRATYGHYEALTFSDYLDLETGKTLRAEPGGTYDIAPASGRVVPDVPEPWFTAAEPLALEAGPEALTVVSATAGMTAEGDLESGSGPDDDLTAGTEHPDDPEG